ncbi:MAG: MobA/MobL family protein [Acidobacteriia bacterium]|nr:MobA/MobL family protein [Terriglobia bacterium]
MAQFRFEIHWPSGRKNSSGCVSKAAYINREKYRDERTGKITADYSKKHDEELLWATMFVDPKRNAPAWVNDPERFWNEASKAEKRWDALECQDAIGNLPHELTLEQNKRWVTDFIREHLTRGTGRAVNVAFHAPSEQSDERNYHCHMLWSLRPIAADGFENNKLPTLTPADVERLREKWAHHGARALERAAREQNQPELQTEADRWRVGHMTLDRQREEAIQRGDFDWATKLDREPQRHEGPKVTAMERDGVQTRVRAINEETQERNDARTKPRVRENPWQHGKQLIRDEWGKKADPAEFRKALRDQGYLLARVSKDEAAQSIKDHATAKEAGRYSPKLYEGEYVFVDEGSRIFRLTPETTGAKTFKTINEYMKPLDQTSVPTLTKTVEFMEMRPEIIAKERSQQRQSRGHDHRKPSSVRKERDIPGRLSRVAERQVGATLDMIGGALNILVPILDPKQKAEGRQADKQKEFAGKEADRAREEAARIAENERRWGGQGRER